MVWERQLKFRCKLFNPVSADIWDGIELVRLFEYRYNSVRAVSVDIWEGIELIRLL